MATTTVAVTTTETEAVTATATATATATVTATVPATSVVTVGGDGQQEAAIGHLLAGECLEFVELVLLGGLLLRQSLELRVQP